MITFMNWISTMHWVKIKIIIIILLSSCLTGGFSCSNSGPDIPMLDEQINFENIEILSNEEMKQLPDLRIESNTTVDMKSLQDRSPVELRLLRNSISAQYGRIFSTKWIQRYFNSRSWYKKGNFKMKLMTITDHRNIRYIYKFEQGLPNKVK